MSTASILSRLRTELRDEGTPFTASVTADGQTMEFDLPVEFIDVTGTATVPFMLWMQQTTPTLLGRPNDYSVDERLGVIITTSVYPNGTILTASGKHYRYFTDDQLIAFINTAALQHTHGQNPPVLLDPPATPGVNVLLNPVEEYLVVLLALVEALWVIATDSSEDIDVLTPDGVQIPRQQRYAMVMQLITAREHEYDKYAALLNVGLNRIEMFELRRVSRTTNRFVPVYRPQEYDDTATPQRIYPPIDTGITP